MTHTVTVWQWDTVNGYFALPEAECIGAGYCGPGSYQEQSISEVTVSVEQGVALGAARHEVTVVPRFVQMALTDRRVLQADDGGLPKRERVLAGEGVALANEKRCIASP